MRCARRLTPLLLLAFARAPSGQASGSVQSAPRAAIVPRVDHHQHLVGPTAVMRLPALPPAPELPAELELVLRERSRIATGARADLFADDARILDWLGEGTPWVSGAEELRRVLGQYPASLRFVPSAFGLGDSVAYVAGSAVADGPPEERMSFTLGLVQDARGGWRIASEHATPVPPPPFAAPLTAAQLVDELDAAGIERAVVLSVAYWFGSPMRTWPGDELANVVAENDWVAAEVAQHPQRLIAFCGVSPLEDYAVAEIRRCARELGVKGVKLHFQSSRVDVLDPEHVERVQRVFEAANELGLALVVHCRTPGAYGRAQALAFLDELLPAAPDVPVQIAHLWGGNQLSEPALAVFADAVAAGDPRTANLWFDLTEVEPGSGGSAAALAEIARRLRQIGLERVLYGSDAAAQPEDPPPALRWARLRHALPLTDDEWRVVAGNEAPYLR